MEALKKALHASVIRELMEQYDSRKEAWIKTNGTDTGFDTWFTKQVKGETPDCDTCHGLGIVTLWQGRSKTIAPCPDCQ
jgi:hypothetical protein